MEVCEGFRTPRRKTEVQHWSRVQRTNRPQEVLVVDLRRKADLLELYKMRLRSGSRKLAAVVCLSSPPIETDETNVNTLTDDEKDDDDDW